MMLLLADLMSIPGKYNKMHTKKFWRENHSLKHITVTAHNYITITFVWDEFKNHSLDHELLFKMIMQILFSTIQGNSCI
jgi:hypothetical protein